MGTHTEPQWIAAALARWERPLVRRTALLLGGDLERARDVVQEAFLRLCRERREKLEGREGEWLFAVTRNLAFDLQRKERPMRAMTSEVGDRHDDAPDPAESAERGDTLSSVARALAELPAEQREALRMKFQDGLSYAEIAGATEQSVANVGWRIHVGLKALREKLGGARLEGATGGSA